MSLTRRLSHHFYDSRPDWRNGTEEFHQLCADTLGKAGKVLEIGAGPSNPTSRFLSTLGELSGADPDDAVLGNDALVRGKVMTGNRLPFEDASFDLCVSNYVVEHVRDPIVHLREVARVLRQGGAYVFRTPNRWHYVALIASLTPHWFHSLVAGRARQLGADAHEPYPTVYALNTRRAILRHARDASLEAETLRVVEKEPSYARFSAAVFLAGVVYERLVNSTALLSPLRSNFFVVLRKP